MANLSTYLLAIIGVCFLLQLIIPVFTSIFIFDPYTALTQPWRFVTSIFLHGGITHLFFNACALFMFGSLLETRISKKDYLILFFGAGIIGSIIYYLTTIGPWPPICSGGHICSALGASGAIYGILGAAAILLPDFQIFFWFFPMKLRYAAILWFLMEFLGTFDQSSGIGSAAHLGGLVFGLAYAWYLNKKTPEFHDTWQTSHY
jgi:membrane associated rhomboid family serine protease